MPGFDIYQRCIKAMPIRQMKPLQVEGSDVKYGGSSNGWMDEQEIAVLLLSEERESVVT